MEKILLGAEMMVSGASSDPSVTQSTHTVSAGAGKKILKKAEQTSIQWEKLYLIFLFHFLCTVMLSNI